VWFRPKGSALTIAPGAPYRLVGVPERGVSARGRGSGLCEAGQPEEIARSAHLVNTPEPGPRPTAAAGEILAAYVTGVAGQARDRSGSRKLRVRYRAVECVGPRFQERPNRHRGINGYSQSAGETIPVAIVI
jgi:hypothetical protein